MKQLSQIKALFYVASIYDGLLGLLFLCAAPAAFGWFQVTPPNHYGYVQFPGALLVVFALMFWIIARNPKVNRAMIPFGILLKLSYCGIVFYYWIAEGLPDIWKPWAIADTVFMIAFIWAYRQLKRLK